MRNYDVTPKRRRFRKRPLIKGLRLWTDDGFLDPIAVYANLRFDSDKERETITFLTDWIRGRGLRWGKKRVIAYLTRHQRSYQLCLQWLIDGAKLELSDYQSIADRLDLYDLVPSEWYEVPEVLFLERHGLSHARVALRPSRAKPNLAALGGLELTIEKPRDPLDPLVWMMLCGYTEGRLDLRSCYYPRCGKFYKPKTQRRIYCSDLCRAKDNQKSPEESRQYMRTYRATKKKLCKNRIQQNRN